MRKKFIKTLRFPKTGDGEVEGGKTWQTLEEMSGYSLIMTTAEF